ncbi:MAG: ATP-binding protein [Clostridia bacterium]|nr:ATP-binding protein [Clostridia bacterium]
MHTELKREVPEDIKKEIIAFANSYGGNIYIGIEDNGKAFGIDTLDSELTKVTNMVRDSISPDITMFVEYKVEKVDDSDILKISVQSGNKKPY